MTRSRFIVYTNIAIIRFPTHPKGEFGDLTGFLRVSACLRDAVFLLLPLESITLKNLLPYDAVVHLVR